MNKDQLIKFLMENIDPDRLINARNNDELIPYYVSVASRLQGNNQRQVNPARRDVPVVNLRGNYQAQTEGIEDEDRPPRYVAPVVNTAVNPQPQRQNNNPNNAQRRQPNTDRVRVATL